MARTNAARKMIAATNTATRLSSTLSSGEHRGGPRLAAVTGVVVLLIADALSADEGMFIRHGAEERRLGLAQRAVVHVDAHGRIARVF